MTVSVEEGWAYACTREDVPPGIRLEVALPDGTPVLIVGTEAGVFACCADCPHQDTPLAEGMVEGTVLTCPVHFWQWDLRDGDPIGLAELPLPLFDVIERDGALHVRRRPEARSAG